MNAFGNRAQTARAVINRIHRRDDREQNLRSANVTRRFVAANVLLARLQGEAIGGAVFSIARNADEPARHMTLVLIACSKKCGMRSAESERNAETLCAADRDVGAKFSGWFQQCERENIGRDNNECAGRVRLFHKFVVIVNRAAGRRILNERAENAVVEFELREVVDLHFDAERFRACANDFDRFRMTIICDEKSFPTRNRRVTKRHRLRRAGRFVQHRCVRDLELCQVDDHLLEIEQRFETALRDLSLIRRISGVPARIFQNVPLNHGRRDAIGVTRADKTLLDPVFLRDRAELSQRVMFRFRLR